MAKEDDLKRVELKVFVNCCEGCKRKVLKALSIKGVLKTEIHPTLPKVTVIGNVDALILIKKLARTGKAVELWQTGAPNQSREDHHKPEVENAHGSEKEKGNSSTRGEKSSSNNSPDDESLRKGDGGGGNNKKAVDEKQSIDGTAGKPISEVTKSTVNHTTSPITIPQVNYAINPSMVQDTAGNATASYAQVCGAAQPYATCYSSAAYTVPPPCCAHHRQCHCELPAYHPPPPIQPLASPFTDYFSDENTIGCSVM